MASFDISSNAVWIYRLCLSEFVICIIFKQTIKDGENEIFLPEASVRLRVLLLPAFVCVCVCLCVSVCVCVPVISELVRAVTDHAFKLEPPNLGKRRKTTWLRFYCFEGWLTLTSNVKFKLKIQIYSILSLSTSHHTFKLEPQIWTKDANQLGFVPYCFGFGYLAGVGVGVGGWGVGGGGGGGGGWGGGGMVVITLDLQG